MGVASDDQESQTGSEDEAEDDDDNVDFEDAANEEVAWATRATIYTTSLPRAVTTVSRTTTPTAGVTTTSTDALIQGLTSVSAAAAAASSSSGYHNDVIADTQLGYDPEMTQLNSPAVAGAFTQQSAGVQVSQEELSLRIHRDELARLWD